VSVFAKTCGYDTNKTYDSNRSFWRYMKL